jgi:hypothetical protein
VRISSPLFFVCCVFALIVSGASAVPQIGQGDPVYLGEYVDISLAPSWPDFAVAWCRNEGSYCTPPDQTVAITGNMHNYYIDPDIFNYGTYYRWDGTWNRGENLNAFIVKPGNRTIANITPIITPPPQNATIISENISKIIESDYKTIVIVRGDSGKLDYYNPMAIGSGHLWMFGGDEFVNGGTHSELDLPLTFLDGNYYFNLSTGFTKNLDYGNYTGYLQFNGKNGFQDVYYIEHYKTPFNATYPVLNSIYKDVPLKSINGMVPRQIETIFKSMVTDPKYSDDIIAPINISVLPPQIIVNNYYEDGDKIHVDGLTSLNEYCNISAVIDPDHYPLPKDLAKNTYVGVVSGNIHGMRTFVIEMNVPWGDLAIGEHEIQFTGTGYQNDLIANQNLIFKVSDIYVIPTPTPKVERVILDDYGWHRVTPEPTATPYVEVTQGPVKLGNMTYDGGESERIMNVTPTVNVTTVATTKPRPVPTTVSVPLNPMLGFLSLMIAMIVLRRD